MKLQSLFLCALLFAAFIASYAPDARSESIWRKLFPALAPKETYNPYLTMKAPFADPEPEEEQKEIQNKKMTLEELEENLSRSMIAPSAVVPVNLPHLNNQAVKQWAVTAASDALTFPESNQKKLKQMLIYFSPEAQKQYIGFLKRSGLDKILLDPKYTISAAVDSDPYLISSREVDGRYKWFLEIPVIVSFLDTNFDDYEDNQPENKRVNLKLQLVRATQDESDGAGLLIEIWSGAVQPIEETTP